MAAVGLGSATAALLLGRATGRYERGVRDRSALHLERHAWTRRALLAGGVGLGIVLLPGILVPPMAALVVLWALNGAGQALIAIPSSTTCLFASSTTATLRRSRTADAQQTFSIRKAYTRSQGTRRWVEMVAEVREDAIAVLLGVRGHATIGQLVAMRNSSGSRRSLTPSGER